MTNVPVIIDGRATIVPIAVAAPQPDAARRRRKLVAVISRTMSQVERASQTAVDAKAALRQIRQAVDPREVAGGFVGLTAGEVIGGAVGGAAGAVVAGPPGALVGAEVGAFAAGMLGLKLGMDAVHDLKEAAAVPPPAGRQPPPSPTTAGVGAILGRKMQGRSGEIVGLTSGATIGLVVAGPAGGLIGAVVGETVGGRIKRGLIQPADDQSVARPQPDEKQGVAQWLDRFGKNTAGEAATVLVAGSVGSVFGLSGLKVGQRIGRVVSKRVEWDMLGKAAPEGLPDGSVSPPSPP